MTEADNIKFSRHKEVRGVGYKKYDNYDAIEVPFTDAIPSDYDGLMGVPISFLSKYNPDQFKIMGITQSWDDPAGLKTKTYPTQIQVSGSGAKSSVGKLNDGAAIKTTVAPEETHYLAPIIHEKSIEASRSIFVNCSSMVDPIWPLIEWRGGSRRVLDNGSTP